jgi:hypothetical protein
MQNWGLKLRKQRTLCRKERQIAQTDSPKHLDGPTPDFTYATVSALPGWPRRPAGHTRQDVQSLLTIANSPIRLNRLLVWDLVPDATDATDA